MSEYIISIDFLLYLHIFRVFLKMIFLLCKFSAFLATFLAAFVNVIWLKKKKFSDMEKSVFIYNYYKTQ